LLKLHPPHITDEPIIARMQLIGIEPGKSFDLDKADPAIKKGLESVPADAQVLMQYGRLRQLLFEARHGHADRSWREPAGGC
jgi:hypothetical protein